MWILGNLLTMRSAVGLLCVLSALLPTGYCLSCKACIELGSTSCRGKSTACPPGTVCGSLFIRVSAALRGVVRSCVQESHCNKPGTFTVMEYKGKQVLSCCTTDNCTPAKPTWSESTNTRPNGLTCPSCYSFSDDCSDTVQVSCSDDDNYCFSQSLQTSGQESYSVTLRGCATENLCQMGNHSVNLDSKTNSIIRCTKAVGGDTRTTQQPRI
ncbi:phospholipase A2 inhibitor subunit gamma B-like [Xenopus tropicalis]|uniref:Phospholipase A2 inhibitor subunit gamma B-like n=1 Tax=Xenopus tropicalis TaxID=8364 RepID=A0A803J3M7_XENTR|nr:phospholipase A2 inhibitor subunit gamma B-like [Xenopus tropicalis]